jgi:hypothetical protein
LEPCHRENYRLWAQQQIAGGHAYRLLRHSATPKRVTSTFGGQRPGVSRSRNLKPPRRLNRDGERVITKVVAGMRFEPLPARPPSDQDHLTRQVLTISPSPPINLSLGPNRCEKLLIHEYVSRTIRISPSAPPLPRRPWRRYSGRRRITCQGRGARTGEIGWPRK